MMGDRILDTLAKELRDFVTEDEAQVCLRVRGEIANPAHKGSLAGLAGLHSPCP